MFINIRKMEDIEIGSSALSLCSAKWGIAHINWKSIESIIPCLKTFRFRFLFSPRFSVAKIMAAKAKVFSPTVKCNLVDRIKIFARTNGANQPASHAHSPEPRAWADIVSGFARGLFASPLCMQRQSDSLTGWLREFYDLNAIYGANS